MLSHNHLITLNTALLKLYEPLALNDLPFRFFEVMSMIVPGHLFHLSITKPGVGAVDAFLSQPAHKELAALASQRESLMTMPGVSDGSFYIAADSQPVSFHDLMPAETLKASVLWECFCKPLDLEYDLSINFFSTPEIFYTISSSRDTKPYDEDERTMLSLLRPHLLQRFRQLAFSEPNHPLAGRTGCPLDAPWLLCDSRGRILSLGPGTPAALRNAGINPNSLLPEEWRGWLTSQLSNPTALVSVNVLVHRNGPAELAVFSLPNSLSGEHRLFLQKRTTVSLTKREREIAHWIAEGKTNKEIADILQISSATVKNHVEKILGKLGAENRTSAAAIFRSAVIS